MIVHIGPRTPAAKRGVTKYGGSGSCSTHLFDKLELPQETREALAAIGNHAITRKTWSTYRTAERMLLRCQKETKHCLELPLSNCSVLVFVDWLIRKRGVKATTVNSYLAGLRQLHIVKGLEEPQLRSGQVQLILRGQANIDATAKRSSVNKGRLPVTMALMKVLKDRIRNQEWDTCKKFLVWSVCTIAFHGGFRIHELLARQQGSFDPDFTLLTQDAKIRECTVGGCKTKFIELKIKNPKESKAGAVVVIDVFETRGPTCPVRAFRKWDKVRDKVVDLPLFRDKAGTPFTGQRMNSTLKLLLEDIIDYKKGSISTHSFRSGLASLMGELGMSDEDIQVMGRWSSRAFERYIKLPRTKRAETALRLGRL